MSESTVYQLLKAYDLITSPAYVVIKAVDAFHTKTTWPNELWQTDFTYFKIIDWDSMCLSTVLDDFSRNIISWKICTNMRADDVTDNLDLALAASDCDSGGASDESGRFILTRNDATRLVERLRGHRLSDMATMLI